MPSPHPSPTPQQRRRLDALHNLIAERDRIVKAYRAAVLDCADAGLTPTQIWRFAGVGKETARRIIARHSEPDTT